MLHRTWPKAPVPTSLTNSYLASHAEPLPSARARKMAAAITGVPGSSLVEVAVDGDDRIDSSLGVANSVGVERRRIIGAARACTARNCTGGSEGRGAVRP